MAELKFTTKQQRFIEEYTVDWNATQAAIRAGYSENTAYSIGQENLKKPEIAKAIEERVNELTMTADEALVRLAKIARADIRDFYSEEDVEIGEGVKIKERFIDLDKDEAQENISVVRGLVPTRYGMKLILHDAQSALVDILRMHGKFVDRVDITSKGESMVSQINFNSPDDGSEPPGNEITDDNGEV